MPEGDILHRASRALQPLVGERIEAESPHPRGALTGVARRVDGRVLESAEAVGKNLLLRFEGGVTVRSHLRMSGKWRVVPRGSALGALRPWLVLRGTAWEAWQLNGPVLEVVASAADVTRRLGPDVLAEGADPAELASRLRAAGPAVAIGDALLDQRVVAGVGNMWKAEALWAARVSPWARIGELDDETLERVAAAVVALMGDALAGGRGLRGAYSRAGRPCQRCGSVIRSFPQGDDARTAYWCPGCQEPVTAGPRRPPA